MSSLLRIFNRLLPFATPGTPLIQDLVHLCAICVVLYFAPAIQDSLRRRQRAAVQDRAASSTSQQQHDRAVDHSAAGNDVDGTVNATGEPILQPNEDYDDREQLEPLPVAEGGPEPLADDGDDIDPQEGPANGHVPTGTASRNVGAKKAKSLARKDQRKAYQEYLRSQGEAQRARDAEGAEEREAALEAERQRRALAEADLIAKKAREREQKRDAEKAEREAEYRRRETAIALVKADLASKNLSDLHRVAIQAGGDVDVEWVEKVIQASGLLGRKGDVLTMITSTGWAATITKQHAAALYSEAATQDVTDTTGNIEPQAMSKLFVNILQQPLLAV